MVDRAILSLKMLPDGRVLQGSPVSIVTQMRSLAFDRGADLEGYIRWACRMSEEHLGVTLEVEGDDVETLARSFLSSVVENGLAESARI